MTIASGSRLLVVVLLFQPFLLCFAMVDDENQRRFFVGRTKSERTCAATRWTVERFAKRRLPGTRWYEANGGNPFMARPRNFARFDWAATHFRKYSPVREFGLRFTARHPSAFLVATATGKKSRRGQRGRQQLKCSRALPHSSCSELFFIRTNTPRSIEARLADSLGQLISNGIGNCRQIRTVSIAIAEPQDARKSRSDLGSSAVCRVSIVSEVLMRDIAYSWDEEEFESWESQSGNDV